MGDHIREEWYRRLKLLLAFPLVVTIFILFFFHHSIPIVPPSDTNVVSDFQSVAQYQVDTKELRLFVLRILNSKILNLNIPEELLYVACLNNGNKIYLPLDNSMEDIDALYIVSDPSDVITPAAAMEFVFKTEDKRLSLYANRNHSNCEYISLNQLEQVEVEGFYNIPHAIGNNDPIVNMSRSRLYIGLSDSSVVFIFLILLGVWFNIIGICNFVRKG